ncbi:MAG TPA: hypothetical protein EYG72_00890, partial [Candidatus Pacebacteria bacterium]|nr:hypothetical protein [Candidatus Paceibacterota bacterium]
MSRVRFPPSPPEIYKRHLLFCYKRKMFKQMKDMYKMQKEAKAIKAELASIHIEAEVDGVIVIVAADQELISIEIPDELA